VKLSATRAASDAAESRTCVSTEGRAMRRGIVFFSIVLVLAAASGRESAAAGRRGRLMRAAPARPAPALRDLVYADLAGVKTPLPRQAKIADLTKSPGYQHGCEQLRRVIRDRPGLGRDLKETDDLWIATAYLFGGADTELRTTWNPKVVDVPAGTPHAFTLPASPTKSELWLAAREGGVELDEDNLWVGLIYELHNGLTNVDQYPILVAKTRLEMITREDYARESIQAEYQAVRRTRLFYVDVYLPWVAAHRRTSSLRLWWCDPLETAEQFAPEGNYLQKYYLSQFDLTCACARLEQKRYAEAAVFFERITRESVSNEHRAAAYGGLGTCQMYQAEHSAAIGNFRRALELQTSSDRRVDLHHRTAYTHHLAGELQQALAAYDLAKRESAAGPGRRKYLQLQIDVAAKLEDPKPLDALCEEHLREYPDERSCAEVERFRERR
jgi:hypothetical protein